MSGSNAKTVEIAYHEDIVLFAQSLNWSFENVYEGKSEEEILIIYQTRLNCDIRFAKKYLQGAVMQDIELYLDEVLGERR